MKKIKKKKIYIIGIGDHAKVLSSILKNKNTDIIFIYKNDSNSIKELFCISEKEFIKKFKNRKIHLINGIAFSPKNNIRLKVNNYYLEKGFKFKQIVSKKSIIHKSVNIGDGVQILNGVIIQNDVQLGSNSIINTGAIIEHGCKIGENCFISPGCVLCGNVKIGDNVYVGPGTCITSNQVIGNRSIIGAGSTILKKVESNKIYFEKKKIIKKKI